MKTKILILLSLIITKTCPFHLITFNQHQIARFRAYLETNNIKILESELKFRMHIFYKNLHSIQKFNSQNHNYFQGENFMTELTDQEIQSYLGLGRDSIEDEYEYYLKNQNKDPEGLVQFIRTEIEESLLLLREGRRLKETRGERKIRRGREKALRQAERAVKRAERLARKARKQAQKALRQPERAAKKAKRLAERERKQAERAAKKAERQAER